MNRRIEWRRLPYRASTDAELNQRPKSRKGVKCLADYILGGRARLSPDASPPAVGDTAWFGVKGTHTCYYKNEELVA